jgi:hypothetical protein
MKKALFLFLTLCPLLAVGQYKNAVVSQMKLQFITADEFIGEDSLGFQYFIKNNTFFKFKNNDTWQYKNVALGKISKADIQNPLRIILFYENFNTVIALDNQLNEVQKLNLSEITQDVVASAVGISTNNTLWVYNSLNMQLMGYNYIQNTFKTLGLPFGKGIKKYETSLNAFYWIDNDNAFYSCDIFGKIKPLGKIPEFDTVFIENETTIIYQKNNLLYLLDLEKNRTVPLEDIEKTYKSFFYKNENLAIFTTEGIINYKINLP